MSGALRKIGALLSGELPTPLPDSRPSLNEPTPDVRIEPFSITVGKTHIVASSPPTTSSGFTFFERKPVPPTEYESAAAAGPAIYWNAAQQNYYKFWRYRYLAGEPLQTDDAYLISFAEECACLAPSLQGAHDDWERLRASYPDIDCRQLDSWICDARLLHEQYVFDDVVRRLRPGADVKGRSWARFDLAVRAGVPPLSIDVAALVGTQIAVRQRSEREFLLQIVDRLRSSAAEDPILAAACSREPKFVTRELFRGLPAIQRFMKQQNSPLRPSLLFYGMVAARLLSYYDTARVRHVAEELVRGAIEMVGATRPVLTNDIVPTVVSGGGEKRVPIRRRRGATVLPASDSLEGLIATVRIALGWESLLLLGLVLRLSESKPWIEGQIALSPELRTYLDRAIAAVGREGGASTVKRAYYRLTAGSRAPWIGESAIADLRRIKMNVTRVRFARNLQRELIGSVARERCILEIVKVVADILKIAPAQVDQALALSILQPDS